MGDTERIQTMERVFWLGAIEPCWGQMLRLLMESSLAGQMTNLGQDGNGRWYSAVCMLANAGSTWSFALKQPTLTMLPALLYRKCGSESTSLQEFVDENNRACQASLAANWMASSTRCSISLPWEVKLSLILMRVLLEEENNSQRA